FLKELQTAVKAKQTPPMTPAVKALAARFDQLFAGGNTRQGAFAAGARAAHALILARYLDQTDSNNWIHFTNIGDWGDDIVARSSTPEFIQSATGAATAAYYQTFKDGTGAPLTGSNGQVYVLNFPAGQLPQAKRFWSVTAYTPNAIELVANAAGKYNVA